MIEKGQIPGGLKLDGRPPGASASAASTQKTKLAGAVGLPPSISTPGHRPYIFCLHRSVTGVTVPSGQHTISWYDSSRGTSAPAKRPAKTRRSVAWGC
jgi:hypothetical protein